MAKRAFIFCCRVVVFVILMAIVLALAIVAAALCLYAVLTPFIWVARHTAWLGPVFLCDEDGWIIASCIVQITALLLVLKPVLDGWDARRLARQVRLVAERRLERSPQPA